VNTPLILGVDFLPKLNLCSDILKTARPGMTSSDINLLKDSDIHLHDLEDLSDLQKAQLDRIVLSAI
jgi:hypothetical protein